MKTKVTFVFLYFLIFPSINSIGIALLTPPNAIVTYPNLSLSGGGVSNYNISQSVKYQVEFNFSLTHNNVTPQTYYFRMPMLNDRQPNSSITQYCPPYQESKLVDNSTTGHDNIVYGYLDKFNNTYDVFNASLDQFETLTLYQKYNITLNEVYFGDIDTGEIGTYIPGDDIHTLYNVTEKFYNCSNPSLINLSNNIVNPLDNRVEKAKDIFNWIVNNIEYQEQEEEIGAFEAYNQGRGDCSDFSDLMITLLRIQSIPARKVTGFLITDYASHRPTIGNKYIFDLSYIGLTETTSFNNEFLGHAWVEYYVPNIGWIACDPTWGQGYFNRIDYFRFNLNVGAWFFIPELSNYYSEFPIHPSIVFADKNAFDFEYQVEITVLETNLTPLTPFPIFVVIFIVAGVSVVVIAVILLLRRGSKKEAMYY